MPNEDRHRLLERRGLGNFLRSVALKAYRATQAYRAAVVHRVRLLFAEVEAEMTSPPSTSFRSGQPTTQAPRNSNGSCVSGEPPCPSRHNINMWALYLADHLGPRPPDRDVIVEEFANLIGAIPLLVPRRRS